MGRTCTKCTKKWSGIKISRFWSFSELAKNNIFCKKLSLTDKISWLIANSLDKARQNVSLLNYWLNVSKVNRNWFNLDLALDKCILLSFQEEAF